jgi:hypothetical protein
MSLTISQIYAVRFGAKLPLPKIVQDNIAKLRITPVTYKPVRAYARHTNRSSTNSDNWRKKVLVEYVRRVKEYDDKDYSDVFSILNKLSVSNLNKLSDDVTTILKKRDESFRLRIVTLLFNKAINEHAYSSLMSDFAFILTQAIPEVKEDIFVQVEMFPKLYDLTETITFPKNGEVDFDNKVIAWMKQKEKRRGCAKFMTQLFVRSLVMEDVIVQSLRTILFDLEETSCRPKTPQTEENTTHLVDFLFETARVLPASAKVPRTLILQTLTSILSQPRETLPSLSMRSRFKAEDTLKCVQ